MSDTTNYGGVGKIGGATQFRQQPCLKVNRIKEALTFNLSMFGLDLKQHTVLNQYTILNQPYYSFPVN